MSRCRRLYQWLSGVLSARATRQDAGGQNGTHDDTATTIVDNNPTTTIVDDETATTTADDNTTTTIADDNTATLRAIKLTEEELRVIEADGAESTAANSTSAETATSDPPK